jgi:hypothetical protein
VAIGALLMLKPAPPMAPPLETIEVWIEPEQALGRAYANNMYARIPADGSADVSAAPPLSPTHPNVAGNASLPNWSRMDLAFDVPAFWTFRPRTQALAFDILAGMLDCLAVGGSARGASGRSRRVHPPCTSEYPLFRVSVPTVVPTDESQSSETNADSDYRTFKPIQPDFLESLFPEGVPNHALKNGILGLFH